MSTAITPLESRRVISGKHGKVFLPGNVFLNWVTSFEARIALDRADINVSGRFQTGYKLMGGSGTGTLNGFHVTSKFRRMIATAFNTGRMPPPTSIVTELSDPDQYGRGQGGEGAPSVERITLVNCNFWESAFGWDVGDPVQNDVPFTFEGVLWPEDEEIRPAGIEY